MNRTQLSVLATASFLSLPAVAVDLFTPGLPAAPDQSLACRIVNVMLIPQVVSSQALDSKGAVVSGVLNQTLAPGEAGGFSVTGSGGAMYCRFRVNAPGFGFRTSIEVFETGGSNGFRIVAALPGH